MRKVKMPDEKNLPKGTNTYLERLISTKGKYFIVTLENYTDENLKSEERPVYNAEIPKKYIKREVPLRQYEQFMVYLMPRKNKKPFLRGYQIILPRLSKKESDNIRKRSREELEALIGEDLKELPQISNDITDLV